MTHPITAFRLALAAVLIALGPAAADEAPGLLKEAARGLDGRSHAKRLVGGELAVTSEVFPGGAGIATLVDLASGRDLAAPDPDPLFTVTMRNTTSGETLAIDADSNWKTVHQSASPNELVLNWSDAGDPRLAGLEVVVTCRPIKPTPAVAAAAPGGLAWRIRVNNACPGWAVWQVVFPRLALRPMGGDTRVLIPEGCGVLWSDLWQDARAFKGAYPGGWATMQFLAAYDEVARSGLYLANPDPAAAMKEITAETDPARRRLGISWTHSPAGMTTAGKDFAPDAPVEWRPLRGDWFDAAMIYRDWVRRSANWFPELGPDGREDTPLWLRELCVWSQIKGSPDKVEPEALAFVEAMGLPSGFHWYRWHRIPFDNDYPHYLPAREGFAATIDRIQKHSARPAYVMPYINGRLWDTRDRGTTDFQFSRLAKPAAVKDIDGNTRGETYRSKEADGSPVSLAPMCPSTPLWQATIRDLVLRLMQENGARAVYVDHADRHGRLAMAGSHAGHHHRGAHRGLGIAGPGCRSSPARAQARADLCQRLRPARRGPLHLRCLRIRHACGSTDHDDRHRRHRKRTAAVRGSIHLHPSFRTPQGLGVDHHPHQTQSPAAIQPGLEKEIPGNR